MRKRILSSVVIVLSLASIAVATYVGLQKRKPSRRFKKLPPDKVRRHACNRNASASAAPLRPADPNRAPQVAVDDALYTNEELSALRQS